VTSQYPAIKNAPLPADGPGSENFSNILLFSLLVGIPAYLTWQLGGGFYTWLFFALISAIPILMAFWYLFSSFSPRLNEKVKLPGKPIDNYLTFHEADDRDKYFGNKKIPMETFHEMYFDGKVDFKGDCLDAMEQRHDWASFSFTLSLFKFFLFGMMPEVIMHTRSQGTKTLNHFHRARF
jgi:sphingolipid C9-methyltransferase